MRRREKNNWNKKKESGFKDFNRVGEICSNKKNSANL
jgi:hypothetical protein